jgi:hypothetical protein
VSQVPRQASGLFWANTWSENSTDKVKTLNFLIV